MGMKAKIKYTLNNETKFVDLKVQAMLYDAVQSALGTALPGARMISYTRIAEPVVAPKAEVKAEPKKAKEEVK